MISSRVLVTLDTASTASVRSSCVHAGWLFCRHPGQLHSMHVLTQAHCSGQHVRRFKAKKGAAGDTKGASKVEPYAYWPLDRKLLNRRADKRADASKGLHRVVKGAKGGVKRGAKAKRPRKG